jgi:hypothetical protein
MSCVALLFSVSDVFLVFHCRSFVQWWAPEVMMDRRGTVLHSLADPRNVGRRKYGKQHCADHVHGDGPFVVLGHSELESGDSGRESFD